MSAELWQVRAYAENVHHLAQEMTNKVIGTTREQTKNAVMIGFSTMAQSEGVQNDSQFPPTPNTTPAKGRRWAFPARWQWNALEDQADAWDTIHEATNEYAIAGAASYNRIWTKRVIDAALGEAQSGNEGALTGVALPAGQIVAAGTDGLTKTKMIQTLSKLQAATGGDADMFGPYTFIYHPDDLIFILNDITLTSDEHTGVHALMMGKQVPGLLGFNWVMSSQLPVVSTTRSAVAYARSGMGTGRNTAGRKIRQDERADLSYTDQVYMEDKFNSVRIDDELVVSVNVDTAATLP